VEVVNNWNKYAQEVEVRKDLREWIGGNLAKARL
jgi:hypothetical protein